MNVRQRTLPFPVSRWEQAVDAALTAISGGRGRVIDELEQGEPDIATLGSEAEQLASSCRSLLERWRFLQAGSPYRLGALPIATADITVVIEAAVARDAVLAGALNLEPELVALLAAQAKLEVGDAIRVARGKEPLRRLSGRTGISTGYLSELESGTKGFPSEEVCNKLDGALGTTIRGRVLAAQETERRLLGQVEARRALSQAVPLNLITLGPRENARMQLIISALLRDPALMALVDGLTRVSAPVVTGIQKLVDEISNDAALRR